MPGEEMEISTDIGHHDPVEDIDIDLDFASGANDEDLELGDFDQTEEFQQFNSDIRDELMAEGDDASYGMAGFEITYNESAAAANDYDIDIGGIDNNAWQVNDTGSFDETSGSTDGVQYGQAVRAEDVDGLDYGSTGGSTLLQAEPLAHVSVSHDSAQDGETSVEDVIEADIANDEVNPLEANVSADGILSQDFGVALTANQGELGVETSGIETANLDEQQDPLDNDQLSKSEEFGDEQHPSEQGSKVVESDVAGPTETLLVTEETEGDDYGSNRDDDEEEEEIDYDPLDDGRTLIQQGNATSTAQNQEQIDQGTTRENAAETGPNSLWTEGAADSTADEAQIGDESYNNDGNYETDANQNEEGASTVPSTTDHSNGANAENDTHDEGNGPSVSTDPQSAAVEHLTSMATRYEILVNYGKTDYRLFAKSESDDPNQYFFKGTSAVELTLDAFLLGLRNVISHEVSPLDELVMHVDGLGLEFSESMTADFLGNYTFGDLLTLYDSLVKNDELGDAPELYMFLTVRPSCAQRLLALQDQANAGRSLTDVALYRESTPVDRNRGDAAFEGEELAISPDEDEELAISPDDELEGDVYDYGEGALEEHDSRYHSENSEHETDANSPGATETTQQVNGNVFADDQHSEEITEQSLDKDAEADLLDYDELDFSTSKQDCQCDSCFLERLESSFKSSHCGGRQPRGDVPVCGSTPSKESCPPTVDDFGGGSLFSALFRLETSKANCDIAQDPTDTNPETIQATVNETANESHDASTDNYGQSGDAASQSTSATVTLDGEDKDEINYDEADDGVAHNAATESKATPNSTTNLIVPADDEITWESENEDAVNDAVTFSSKPSEQVSTTPGKRTRSDSDVTGGAGEQKDVKRRRS